MGEESTTLTDIGLVLGIITSVIALIRTIQAVVLRSAPTKSDYLIHQASSLATNADLRRTELIRSVQSDDSAKLHKKLAEQEEDVAWTLLADLHTMPVRSKNAWCLFVPILISLLTVMISVAYGLLYRADQATDNPALPQDPFWWMLVVGILALGISFWVGRDTSAKLREQWLNENRP